MPDNEFQDIYNGLSDDERRAVDEAAMSKMRTLIGNKLKGLQPEPEPEHQMTGAELRAAELEELKPLRGDLGERAQRERARINSKYQALRYGEPKPDASLEWLRMTREARNQPPEIPDNSPQSVLWQQYLKAVEPFRGNLRKVSEIQSRFRAKGLKV